jgi:pimeloyl-ACP methyl ester carboxylesterase
MSVEDILDFEVSPIWEAICLDTHHWWRRREAARARGRQPDRAPAVVHPRPFGSSPSLEQAVRVRLAGSFRLVAIDLRGHGLSDKPRNAYSDSQLWTDDVHAVITELGLERPIASASSYGGIVVCDYLRCYGDAGLGGVHFVGAMSKLGTNAALAVSGLSCSRSLPPTMSKSM